MLPTGTECIATGQLFMSSIPCFGDIEEDPDELENLIYDPKRRMDEVATKLIMR